MTSRSLRFGCCRGLLSGSAALRGGKRRRVRVSVAVRPRISSGGGRDSSAWRLLDRMGPESAKDKKIGDLATSQHGVLSRAQLRELGFSDREIARRLERGRLIRMHRGVFAVGHTALKPEGYWMAAVLACGPDAALSHASAAALWGIRPTSASLADVVVPTQAGRSRRKGIRVHRTDLPQRTTHRGIPVTSPARTLTDLATTLPRRALTRAVEEAAKRDLDLSGLKELTGRPGATAVRQELNELPRGNTRSTFGIAFLRFCRAHKIPAPEANVHIQGLLVDFTWPGTRVVVEADSFEHHGTRQAFERDRHRDAVLHAAGYRTARYTHRQLTKRPHEVKRALQRLLSEPDPRLPTAPARAGARR